MFVHKVLFEFLEFKHPRLLLVSPSDTSTGGGLLGVKFLASENWCGRVHFGGHSPEWRVLAKFSVQHCMYLCVHFRECYSMAHQELERPFSLELLHTIQNALLSESRARSWFRSSLVKVLEWSGNCLLWQGK